MEKWVLKEHHLNETVFAWSPPCIVIQASSVGCNSFAKRGTDKDEAEMERALRDGPVGRHINGLSFSMPQQ